MKPKLNSDTFYLPASDGVLFRNNHGWLKLTSKAAYGWLDRLSPYLNGRYTLAEITAGLDPDKQAMVHNLVQILHQKGLLTDVADDRPHTLSQAELETYAAELDFIASFGDSAGYRFERLRRTRLLLVGAGLPLTALVHATLRMGVQQIDVVTTGECATDLRRHQEYLELLQERDPALRLIAVAEPAWDCPQDVAALLEPYDAVLHLTSRPMLARSRLLNRLSRERQKLLLQAVMIGDEAWVGPLVRPATTDCWECAWRRRQTNLTNPHAEAVDAALADQPAAPISPFVAAPTTAFVANLLSFELLKARAEVGTQQTAGALVRIDLETLSSQRHRFVAYPDCATCQCPEPAAADAFRARIDRLIHGAAVEQEHFSKQAVAWFDARLGLFRSLDEQSTPQLPLHVAHIVLSNPALQPGWPEPLTVTGVGLDFGTARRQATRRACELYAISALDPRRLPQPSRAEIARLGVRPLDLPAMTELEQVRSWAWAYAPQRDAVRLVPAASVFPALSGAAPALRGRPGLASGMSWSEALSRALLSLAQQQTVASVLRATEPFPQVDLGALELDADGRRLVRMLAISDLPLTVYDVTGPLEVPTFAFAVGGQTVAYSSHLESARALSSGLEQVLQQIQLAGAQPADTPPVAQLPAALRGDQAVTPDDAGPESWEARVEWLLHQLDRQGWSVVVVPLDHDPALAEVLPYIVQAVLVRGAA